MLGRVDELPPVCRQHLRSLAFLAIVSRVVFGGLIALATSSLALFDTSPKLVLYDGLSPWISSLLRWDAFHFVHVAQEGHVYEHEWAFFPGLALIMRSSAAFLSALGLHLPALPRMLLGGAILAVIFDSTRVLYVLSLHHLHSPSAAFVAAALSLLPSSPAALRYASYSEPFFTYFSYRGMLSCARDQWLVASICFALASTFRSNGIFLCGFIIWGTLVKPFLSSERDVLTASRMVYCTLLVAIPLVPFIHHNYKAYVLFCTTSPTDAPDWCRKSLCPMVYSHVQLKYWNIGFLRYWTLSNLPNFILALPVLLNVYTFCAFYLSRLPRIFPSFFALTRLKDGKNSPPTDSLFLDPTILPHVLYGLAMALLLTFNAHVQISLRVLPSMPITYWAAAHLLIDRPALGKAWVTWSVIWGALSCVLWATFLPPA
ncbi:glycosyltransferase family 76 protein [Phlebopus sp. FC_14]|nr:glycosyltransferase family 76 protein [Phlebopus sp. FC_14]